MAKFKLGEILNKKNLKRTGIGALAVALVIAGFSSKDGKDAIAGTYVLAGTQVNGDVEGAPGRPCGVVRSDLEIDLSQAGVVDGWVGPLAIGNQVRTAPLTECPLYVWVPVNKVVAPNAAPVA